MALKNFTNAANISQYNIEALKGILACNYQLCLYEETWDLTNQLKLDEIHDPSVFLGFYQIGSACIENMRESGQTRDENEEIKELEIKCNILLNYALTTTESSNIDQLKQLSSYFFDNHNYQSVR